MSYFVECQNIGGFKFLTKCRHHYIIVDQPVEKGGDDSGPKPPELFIASLASCIGQVIVIFCQRHQISTQGMTLKVTWNKEPAPGKIKIELIIPTEITEESRKAIIRLSKQCAIHKLLHNPPIVEFCLKKEK
ncbi:MAG: OsmC family protein [Candidatus Odinarchaeota archaeon]|nr:OsmC family protein [Candidatus Odinarchaeota archaeon]